MTAGTHEAALLQAIGRAVVTDGHADEGGDAVLLTDLLDYARALDHKPGATWAMESSVQPGHHRGHEEAE
jgi:hypothetical protein